MSAKEQVYEGSCQCRRVRYRVVGPWGAVNHCHCTDCQKMHGAAFATYVQTTRARLTWIKGKKQLQMHQVESGTQKWFCRTCGSIILNGSEQEPQRVWMAVGTLDTPLEVKDQCHIFVRSKAPWYEIRDGLPQHATFSDSEA